MADLRDLYQEVILDHSRNPRNFRKLENANKMAEGFNPLCGDQIVIYVKLENQVIEEICFQGSGCAIAKASASLMTDVLKHRTIEEAETFFTMFHQMITGSEEFELDHKSLGKLIAFVGVKEYPVRVKCATLAWHTFRAALQSKKGRVSTE